MANGWGGRRPGSGKKKEVRAERAQVLRPAAFASLPDAPVGPPDDPHGLLVAPTELPEAERGVWLSVAPHALLERTLTVSRVAGFKLLCKRWVYCDELDARIRVLGITSAEADRLLKRFETWQKLLSASLGEFNLRSFGKPVVVERPKPAANPFAAFGGAAK